MSHKNLHSVYFLVPPEVQLLDITGPAHLFYEAQEYGAKIETFYLSFGESLKQTSCTGLLLGNLIPFHEFTLTSGDLIFIPGLESAHFLSSDFKFKNQAFLTWLGEQYKNGAKICSICTGAYILAHAGLLDDKDCTTHWKYLQDLQSRFPKAKILPDRLIVKDGNIYSSAGVSSGIDLALFIMEELFGPVFTTKVAKEVVIYMRRTEGDPQLSVFLQYRNHIENRIHEVQDILAQNLSSKVKIAELAEKIHMSPRNLTRLFKKTTGITIGSYLDKLRIERAEQLLSNGSKVSAVARECGLQSANQLRNLLKKKS